MSDQIPFALTIPEILREMLQHLEPDRKALCSVDRVNRAWAEEGLNILWHHLIMDGARRLASVSKHRRQFYADKLRSWDRDLSSIEYQYHMRKLNFPRLKRVDLWLTKDNLGCNHQLVPNLEDFRLHIDEL